MEENLKKQKKNKGKNVQRKGNYFKSTLEEKKQIEFLVDKNLNLVPEYFKPEYRILFDTFQVP